MRGEEGQWEKEEREKKERRKKENKQTNDGNPRSTGIGRGSVGEEASDKQQTTNKQRS